MLLDDMKRVTSQPPDDAQALPFAAYRDVAHFEREQREVFEKDWVFVCTEADLSDAGDYHTLTIGNEPVFVIRGQDETLRVLSNVCRHRGAQLLDGSGNTRRVVCPFHAWTYGDEGELRGVPHPGAIAVNKDAHCLPAFRLESWFGLVFVTLDKDAPPVADRFRGIEAYLSRYGVDQFRHAVQPIQFEHWNANWKLAIENFVEGYHFFSVHPETVEPAAPTRECFYVEGHADWSVMGGRQLDGPSTLSDWIRGKTTEVEYLSICLTPNFVCNLYEDYMTWVRVLPTGPTTTEIAGGVASRVAFEADAQSKSFSDRILSEDREICERVQRGTRSRRSEGGRLVEMERAVADFHQYLGKRLFGEGSSQLFRTRHAERFGGRQIVNSLEEERTAAALSK